MNKTIRYVALILGIILIILSFVFKSRTNDSVKISMEGLSEFNKNINGYDSYSYIDFVGVKNKDGFKMVYKNDEPFIAYFNNDIINTLNDYQFNGVTVKLVGKTAFITPEIKNKVLQMYNEGFESFQEDYLKEDSFEDLFGHYYLDVQKIINDRQLYLESNNLYTAFINLGFTLIIGFVFLLIIEKKGFK